MKQIPLLLIALVVGLLTGCANPWQSNFQPNPMYGAIQFAPTDSVQIRTVEYERFQRFAERERQIRIDSPVAFEDLPAEEQLAARQRLLEALQIQVPPGEIMLIGTSEFTETRLMDPQSDQLRNLAQRRGADIVVVTSVYRGPVTTLVREPVTTYSQGWATGSPARRGRFRSFNYSDSTTTWIPVQITEDAFFHQAFFLRRVRAGEVE